MPVDNWQQATQVNSPQSVRQAVMLGVVALLLAAGLLVMRLTLDSVAEEAGPKTKATPCRRV
jgi:hypothetical protein